MMRYYVLYKMYDAMSVAGSQSMQLSRSEDEHRIIGC